MHPSETAIIYSLGLGVAGIVFAYLTAINFYKIENFRRVDVTRVGDLKDGLNEIHGKIVALEEAIISPWQEEECVCYRLSCGERNKNPSTPDVWLQLIEDNKFVKAGIKDDSGCAVVMLDKAEIECFKKLEMQEKEIFPEAIAMGKKYNKRLSREGRYEPGSILDELSAAFPRPCRMREECLPVGTEVFAMGDVQIKEGEPPLMWAFNHPLVVSDTCINRKTRPPMKIYKITLVLAAASLVLAFQLYSGAILVKDIFKGHLF